MSAIEEPTQLLTIDQVASLCQVSTKTVYRAIRRGALRASRLGAGGAYRVRPEAMERWIDACAEPAARRSAEPLVPTPQPGPESVPRARQSSTDGRLTLQPGMGRDA
jgi:excisionase family DNA binding protein